MFARGTFSRLKTPEVLLRLPDRTEIFDTDLMLIPKKPLPHNPAFLLRRVVTYKGDPAYHEFRQPLSYVLYLDAWPETWTKLLVGPVAYMFSTTLSYDGKRFLYNEQEHSVLCMAAQNRNAFEPPFTVLIARQDSHPGHIGVYVRQTEELAGAETVRHLAAKHVGRWLQWLKDTAADKPITLSPDEHPFRHVITEAALL